MNESDRSVQQVEVRNFDMSFGRMIWFMVKWAIAAIPALLLLLILGYISASIITGVFSGIQTATNTLSAPPGSALEALRVAERVNDVRSLMEQKQYAAAYTLARSLMNEPGLTNTDRYVLQDISDKAWKEMNSD